MSIPYWREKEYTDDGCSVFECLNCYCTWESRTPPWHEYEGKRSYGVKWRMCPICGCLWVGKKTSEKVKYYPNYNVGRLYPCRFKIVEVYKDTSGQHVYESRETYCIGVTDPKRIIEYLKELREKEKEDAFNEKFHVSVTYHVEKIN